jgi:uncharacterized protein
MAQVPDRIVEIIKKFILEAKKDNININKAILFGSYSNGTYNKWSDIDVAVVSDDFAGDRLFDNIKLSRSRLNTNIDLETHPFRTQDFTLDNLFVKEILKNGIEII